MFEVKLFFVFVYNGFLYVFSWNFPLPYVPSWIQHPHPLQSTHSFSGYAFAVSNYHNLYPTPHPPLIKDSDITIPTPICSLSPQYHYATLPQSFESFLHKISVMFVIGFSIRCYTLNLVSQTPDIPKHVSTMNQ